MGSKEDLIGKIASQGGGRTDVVKYDGGSRGRGAGFDDDNPPYIDAVYRDVTAPPQTVEEIFTELYPRVNTRLSAAEAKDTDERLYASRLAYASRWVKGDSPEEIFANFAIYRQRLDEMGESMERASLGGSTADIEQSKLYDQGLGYIARYAGHKGPDDYDRGGEMTYKQAVAAIKALPIQKWEIRILLNQLAQESALKSTPDDEESIHPVVAGVAAIVVGCFACAGWTWWVELAR